MTATHRSSLIALAAAVLALAACAERPDPPPAPRPPADHATPVVLFVEPDSAEIDALQRRLGEDFFVVADDAMWYRAAAREYLDSLRLPYAQVGRGSARFLVDGRPTLVGWEDVDRTWFVLVYDGRSHPVIASDVDIRDAVAGIAAPAR